MRRFADSLTWADDRRGFAIDAALDERLGFIRRTYGWLVGELAAVAALTTFIMGNETLRGFGELLMRNIILYIAVWFGASLASRAILARGRSLGFQLAGAGIWVFFLSLLVAPFVAYIGEVFGGYGLVWQALVLTGCVFTGLTAYVLFTKKDFSWMRGALWGFSFVLIGLALISFLFGSFIGPWYSIAWVVLLGGWILYDTSQVLHRFPIGQHVAASVNLLVDFVLMFLHILSLLASSRD